MRQSIRRTLRLCLMMVFTIFWVAACSGNLPHNTASQRVSLPASEYRVVEHAMGETQVPSNPQRVAALNCLDEALSLGITPVGYADYVVSSYLGENLVGIEKIGSLTEPNLEKILTLKPDLILGHQAVHGAIYKQCTSSRDKAREIEGRPPMVKVERRPTEPSLSGAKPLGR